MAEPKPLASLSSGLLARKGHAKPAMRRQGYDGMNSFAAHGQDDLGWNDMGHDEDHDEEVGDTPVHRQIENLEREISVARQSPATMLTPIGQDADDENQIAEEVEEVEVKAVAEPVIAEAVKPVAAEPLPLPTIAISRAKREVAGRAKSAKGKAAFTLRLDQDRHLKLRLASAIERVSAQQLVTIALDRMLDAMPDLEAIAGNAANHHKLS